MAGVWGSGARALVRKALLGFLFMMLMPAAARAVGVFDKDGFTLDLGLRLQPRMELERLP